MKFFLNKCSYSKNLFVWFSSETINAFSIVTFIYQVLHDAVQWNNVSHFYGDVGFDDDYDDDDDNYDIFNLINVGKNLFSFLFLLKFH